MGALRPCFILIFVASPWVQSLSVTLHSEYQASLLVNISAHLKAHGYLGGELSGPENHALMHQTDPLFMEVAAPKGSSRSNIEAKIMAKYIPGQPAYRLTVEDRVMHDDAYKSRLLNFIPGNLDKDSTLCKSKQDCIERFIVKQDKPNNLFYKVLKMYYQSAVTRGCMAVGGCRADVMTAFDFHVQRDHNIIFESTGDEYKNLQGRTAIVSARGDYKAKVLVVVALKYATVQARFSKIASTNIYAFLQNPKLNPAPLMDNPRELAAYVSEFVCGMNEVLDCLGGISNTIFQYGDAPPRPCEPMVDGMFVFDNTKVDGAEKVAVAMKGDDVFGNGFQSARAILQETLPPDAPPCQRKVEKKVFR